MGHDSLGTGRGVLSSFDSFVKLFCYVFDHTPEGKEMGEQLLAVMQGRRNTAEYALEFRMLAAGSRRNESTLKAAFRQGLNPEVLTELACHDDRMYLDLIWQSTLTNSSAIAKPTNNPRACI